MLLATTSEVHMRTAAARIVAVAIALSAATGCATTARATAPRDRASARAVDAADGYTMPPSADESTRLPPLTAF
jgi:hypothetical protein